MKDGCQLDKESECANGSVFKALRTLTFQPEQIQISLYQSNIMIT